MAIPPHPTSISIGTIRNEFGGDQATSLGQYYAGAGRVPAGTVGYPRGHATPIPSSGMMSIGNFHGASKQVFLIVESTRWINTVGFSRFTGYLIGGGGGGGTGDDNPRHGMGGGGGAGGVVFLNNIPIAQGDHLITIGHGGQGHSLYNRTPDRRGGDSHAFGYTAFGGGGGGGYVFLYNRVTDASGGSGGSGGGVGSNSYIASNKGDRDFTPSIPSVGAGTPGQGNDGSPSRLNQYGGGGGGFGGTTGNQNGGPGLVIHFPQFGFYRLVAGGGGGGSWRAAPGFGQYGGGNGGPAYSTGGNGVPGTGGGGGGGGETGAGGFGGSGLLVGILS